VVEVKLIAQTQVEMAALAVAVVMGYWVAQIVKVVAETPHPLLRLKETMVVLDKMIIL